MVECLVEEDLRTESAIGAVVELSGFRRRKPGFKPEDRHEVVVVPLSSHEVGYADADVVDESGPGHLLLLLIGRTSHVRREYLDDPLPMSAPFSRACQSRLPQACGY